MSLGYEDKDYRTLELMKEGTSHDYRLYDELMIGQPLQQFTTSPQYNQVPKYNTTRIENQGNIGGFRRGF